MLIFGQSYASPQSMADSTIYKKIFAHFKGDVKLVSLFAKRTRNLTKREEVKLGYHCYKLAKNNDILFGWGGDLCLFAWLIGLFGNKKITYLSQNLIINPEISHVRLHRRIRFYLYKIALKSKSFMVTVNAPGLSQFYSNIFNCSPQKFYVVYDSMSLSEEETGLLHAQKALDKKDPYVFFGGKSFRDIPTFLQVVRLLPNVKFKAVILKDMILPEMAQLKNLEVLHDLEINEFYRILSNATVCCIPLKANVPCGLYVMQHAILMGIPIVSTETPSMRTIIPNDDYGFLLPREDSFGMANKVENLLHDEDLIRKVTSAAKINMEKFTPESVAEQLCDVIDTIKNSK